MGVEFTEKGVRWIDDTIRIIDGEDAYRAAASRTTSRILLPA